MAERLIEYQGVKRSLVEWAAILGISKQLLHSRLKRYPADIAFNPKKFLPGRGKLLSSQIKKENTTEWSPTEEEIARSIKIEKVDGLADIIAVHHREITQDLFSSGELERLKKIKERKSLTNK